MTQKSGAVIVVTAFSSHFLKEISRTQLLSAAKILIPQNKKKYSTFEKNDFLLPLGKAFVEKAIVKIREGADVKNLSRNDVEKVGTF